MKLAIIDSFENDCTLLSQSIKSYLDSQKISSEITSFNSAKSFMEVLFRKKFHAIFLDIHLKDIDGMSIAYEIRKIDKNCLLIFVTSSQIHAIESFRVRAFYYLLKPYTKEHFIEMMELCCNKISKNSSYLEVKEGRVHTRILHSNILFIDTNGHYIQIHTNDKLIRSRMKFDEIADLLKHDNRFVMCYRNVLVNLEMTETIIQQDILLKNGDKVPIQRNRIQIVRQNFLDFIFQKEN